MCVRSCGPREYKHGMHASNPHSDGSQECEYNLEKIITKKIVVAQMTKRLQRWRRLLT